MVFEMSHEEELRIKKDLIKAWIAIDSDTCPNGFYKADYLKEKIERIIDGTMVWHANIESIDCIRAQEYIRKRMMNGKKRS